MTPSSDRYSTATTRLMGSSSPSRTGRSLLRGDAEGVDRAVDLHGGEGGLGRDVIGDGDRVVPAGEPVVEENERITLGGRRHKRRLPPDSHLDVGRACER